MIECDQAIIHSGHKTRSGSTEAGKEHTSEHGKEEEWSVANRIAQDLRKQPQMWINVHEEKLIVPIGVWTDGKLFSVITID